MSAVSRVGSPGIPSEPVHSPRAVPSSRPHAASTKRPHVPLRPSRCDVPGPVHFCRNGGPGSVRRDREGSTSAQGHRRLSWRDKPPMPAARHGPFRLASPVPLRPWDPRLYRAPGLPRRASGPHIRDGGLPLGRSGCRHPLAPSRSSSVIQSHSSLPISSAWSWHEALATVQPARTRPRFLRISMPHWLRVRSAEQQGSRAAGQQGRIVRLRCTNAWAHSPISL